MNVKINNTLSQMVSQLAISYHQTPEWVVEDLLRQFFFVWSRGRLSGLDYAQNQFESAREETNVS